MRKLAMLLAAILTLNLAAPAATAYAAPAESVTDGIASETLTETDMTDLSASGNELSVSDNDPTDPDDDLTEPDGPSVSDNNPTEPDGPSVSDNDEAEPDGPSVSDNDPTEPDGPSVSDNDPAVSENDITNLYVVETYYKTKNGYPLVGIIEVPYPTNLEDWHMYDFTFKELSVSVDDGESEALQIQRADCYTYDYTSENQINDGFLVRFNAGYDKTITEGTHKLTYTGIVTDGTKEFPFEVYAEAEFSDGDVTYSLTGSRKMQYMSANKGSLVKMIYSNIDVENSDEKIKSVKLRNSETGQEYGCDLLYKYEYGRRASVGLRYSGFVGLDNDYTSIFNQDYYSVNFHSSIQLKEEIPEGDYDLVFITSEGNRNIIEKCYRATKKPVVYALYENSIKEKGSTVDFYKTGLPIYPNNNGNYVSVFVYGLNLTKDNVPVFYSEDRTATVTEYAESDEMCGYEEWEYGFDFTVKKTGDITISGNEVSIPASVNGDVIYVDGWGVDEAEESEQAFEYYQDLVNRTEYNVSAKTLRFYLNSNFVSEGDIITATGYKTYNDYYGGITQTGEATVLFDGTEHYIEFGAASEIFQNYPFYADRGNVYLEINDDTTRHYYYSMYDISAVKYINNVTVPANYSWEIHDATGVVKAFYEGKNGGTKKKVLTAEQVNDLTDEGLCRVCIYDNKGNVSERYLAYFTSKPLYNITYVLNGGTNHPDNPLQYSKDQEVILETPTYEYNTFVGWYSDAKCTKKVTKIAKGSTGDKTFYAKWKTNEYSITYYPNGGNGKAETKTYPYNQNIVFPSKLFSRTGYKLAGWNTEADGTGDGYSLYVSIPALTKENGVKYELYAVWEPIQYTLILDKGLYDEGVTDGTVEEWNNRFEVSYDDVFVLSGNEYEYRGHKITGWKTDSGKKISNGEVSRLSAVDNSEVTLYAQWALEKYTITYDYAGGKVKKANPKSYTCDTPAYSLNNNVPTKKGYIFNGYYAVYPDTGMEEPITVIGGGQTGNLNIRADYSPISYTVILKETKDSTDEESVKVPLSYDEMYTFESGNYQKDGYTLSNWTTKPNGKGTKYKVGQSYKNLTAQNGKEIELYADWKKDSYSITYNLDGGKNHKNNPKKYAVDSKTIKLEDPTKTGYTFKGWYETAEDGTVSGNKILNIEKGTTGDLVLTAIWEPNSYMLRLHPNNRDYVSGDILIQYPYIEQQFAYEDEVKISDLTVSKYEPTDLWKNQGIGILYWSTKPNGNGKKYYPDEMYSKLKAEGTVELYAKWGKVSYEVNYVGTEGINNPNPATYTYDDEAVIKLKDVSKKGYVFGGWFTDASFAENSNIEEIKRNERKEITLYAKFTPIEYTVKLAPNGNDVVEGNGDKEFTKAYDEAFSVSANSYTREHYRIAYWSTKPNGKGTKVYSDEEKAWNLSSNGATVTLYPKWQLVPYSITYNNVEFSGEKVVNKSPSSYTYNVNKEVKLKNPTRTGYVFGGWYTEDTTAEGFNAATATPVKKLAKGESGNKELYALWTPITYKVQLEANGKNAVLGEGISKVQNVTYGQYITLAGNSYTREGYNLVEFNSKKNGKGTSYALNAEHKIYASKAGSTVKLYAIWEKVETKKVLGVELSSEQGSVSVWFAMNEGCGEYEVAFSEFFTMKNAFITRTTSDTASFSDLLIGQRYFVRVREIRYDSLGNEVKGPWSSLVSIKAAE